MQNNNSFKLAILSVFLSFILITSGSSVVQPAQSQSQEEQQPYTSTEDVLNDLFPNFDQQLQQGSEAAEYFNIQFEEELPVGTPCTPSTPCGPAPELPTHTEQESTQSSSESSSICIEDPVLCAPSCLKDIEGNNIKCIDTDYSCPEEPDWSPGEPCPDSTMESESPPDEEEIPAEDGCSEVPGDINVPIPVPISRIPVDPGNGGRSIDISALQIGDIILSTTDELPSKLIRFGTNSPVSHSILYVGDGQVIEAVEDGVRLVPIETALADSNFAVAVRYPGLTHDQALQIRDFAGKQLGKLYDYEYGVVGQAMFRIELSMLRGQPLCLIPQVDEAMRFGLAFVNLGTVTNDKWFCSELVLASYAAAGAPLTKTPPHWTAPGEIIPLISNGNLEYVGHLKTQ